MGKRHRAREFALQLLYGLDVGGGEPGSAIDTFWAHFRPPQELRAFTRHLVEGVCAHREALDRAIAECSEHWSVHRMATVDRNILRMAAFELLFCEDIPPNVTLNEAIELGKRYGSEDSGPFINGILDHLKQWALAGGLSGRTASSSA